MNLKEVMSTFFPTPNADEVEPNSPTTFAEECEKFEEELLAKGICIQCRKHSKDCECTEPIEGDYVPDLEYPQ